MITGTVRELIKIFRAHLDENTILSAGSITEIAKLPVIVLNGPVLTEKKRLMRDPERILLKNEEEAVYEVPPRWYDLRFDVNISCSGNPELLNFIELSSRLNQEYPLIEAKANERERKYLWRWNKPLKIQTVTNVSQVFQCNGELTVYDVEVYSNIREIWPLIRSISADIESGSIKNEKINITE